MKRHVSWLAAALIIIIIFGSMYIVVEQVQRSDANYPQIQIAEDAATALNHGVSPASLVTGRIDLASSLDPFTIIYGRSGRIVAGSGYLDGSIPQIPAGVLRAADGAPYHIVTWQPQTGVRIAAVSVSADKYYVVSGRSLREVEKNEDTTLQLSALGGVASLIVLAAAFALSFATAEAHISHKTDQQH